MRSIGIALALLVGGVAAAQSEPSYNQPLGNTAKQDTTVAQSKADEVFAKQAAAGGLAEVQLSKLAMEKAQSLEVKQFARRMVEDHSKANMELKQIAEKQNLTLPQKLDAKHQHVYDKLSKLSGADFDREYMKAMMQDHDDTVAKFKNEAQSGQDADMKSFAMRNLSVIEKHDSMAHDDATKLKEHEKEK